MARKTITVMVSDLTGQDIPADEYAKVIITTNSSRYTADVRQLEVAELMSAARKSKRPGRKAKTAA